MRCFALSTLYWIHLSKHFYFGIAEHDNHYLTNHLNLGEPLLDSEGEDLLDLDDGGACVIAASSDSELDAGSVIEKVLWGNEVSFSVRSLSYDYIPKSPFEHFTE